MTGDLNVQLAAGTDETAAQTTTWPTFRGSPDNNAITVAKTPRTKAEAGLLWAATLEEGYVSPEIIVDDEIIVTSGRGDDGVISKIDKNTGKVIAQAPMKKASTFSLMPPTYADGKIFVTLSGGSMEAFDAKTLKSLWFYENELGGQGNCPIVYSDGLVYTGYWTGETAERSFVCVDASTGKLVWELRNAGGYYWTGALVVGDYLIFGCEDGKTAKEQGNSKLRCVNKKTGEVVSSVTVKGDQRSTIVYDAEQGRAYFTTKPGWLYGVRVNEETGVLSDLESCKVDVETTGTPAVYDGRVYVGGSSGGFSKGTLSVVDAATLKMLYQLGASSGVVGTVKSAPLVSTAYENAGTTGSDGKLYLYFTVNNPPGGIKLLIVEPNSTSPSQAKVIDLFTPPAVLEQYCISSVICDADGNLYYRNDSNYLMCVSPNGSDPATYEVPPSNNPNNGGMGPTSSSSSEQSKSGKGSSSSSSKSQGASQSSASSSNAGENSGQGSSSGDSSGGGSSGDEASAGTLSRSGGIQQTGANTSRVTGTSQTGTSASRSAGASAGAAQSSGANDKGSTSSSITGLQGGGARHTDAEAATERLDDTADDGAPAWLVPAIVVGVAALALVILLIVRIVLARRSSDVEGDSTPDSLDARESGGSHER